jgi:hypothetical protein
MGQLSDTITIIIAVYGAVLATLGFALSLVLGINEIQKQLPRIKVKLTSGFLIDRDGKSSEPLIIFEAYNNGQFAVEITGCGWLALNRAKYQFSKPYLLKLPYTLEPHRIIQTYFCCRWFRDLPYKEKINGIFFVDEGGNQWNLKINKKQLRQWEAAQSKGYLIEWNKNLQEFYRQDT